MQRLFEGKVALVTSAASAAGRVAAFSYAANGAFVIVSDIEDNDTVNKIIANGGNAVFLKTDISKETECEKLVQKIISTYGKIDIAFNNPGILSDTIRLIDNCLAGFVTLKAPNVNSVFYCTKYEIEAMRQQQGGIIINMSSLAGNPSPSRYFSRIEKATDTQNETPENSDNLIRIHCIASGFADTRLPDTFNLKSKEDIFLKKSKEERSKKPEQIAELLMWLSSEKTSFATNDHFIDYGGYMEN